MPKKMTVQDVAREQIRQGVPRSVAVDALVQRGIPRDSARIAVDNALQKSAGFFLSASTVTLFCGLGLLALGILLSIIVPNIIFTGLIGCGAIMTFKGLLGGSKND